MLSEIDCVTCCSKQLVLKAIPWIYKNKISNDNGVVRYRMLESIATMILINHSSRCSDSGVWYNLLNKLNEIVVLAE